MNKQSRKFNMDEMPSVLAIMLKLCGGTVTITKEQYVTLADSFSLVIEVDPDDDSYINLSLVED